MFSFVIGLNFIMGCLGTDVELVSDTDNIQVKYYSVVWPPHEGGPHVLFYKGKKLCSRIEAVYPTLYILSPDKKLILYINKNKFDKISQENYEIYNIENGKTIIFPEVQLTRIVWLNDKVIWEKDKVILSNEERRAILNLSDSTIQIENIKK